MRSTEFLNLALSLNALIGISYATGWKVAHCEGKEAINFNTKSLFTVYLDGPKATQKMCDDFEKEVGKQTGKDVTGSPCLFNSDGIEAGFDLSIYDSDGVEKAIEKIFKISNPKCKAIWTIKESPSPVRAEPEAVPQNLKDEECQICQLPLGDKQEGEAHPDKLGKLKCNHDKFHHHCIHKWLDDKTHKCPICRTEGIFTNIKKKDFETEFKYYYPNKKMQK
ncbi:hypothetical protein BU24DRAFT_451497 [Aaosphaeria arxii CBS 175.79]|uniref:RING-type domain-containing protein n=1 Tax=Aaosphaeria arxii CBS 175.79 TaxID=1450172 RepID=A0A6A5XNF5_9PLEO|nr:uncharacterized protein BU24DRAFT_451497 [Aaosphaeria arxii CBS 175.79]KAF2014463.1 hypothetical protein BU24DRAFT_451497 [Aaosphaeria arxii CBS 175.79]